MELSSEARRIINVLIENRYQYVGSRADIASISFDFDALLVGSEGNSDLIVIFDTLTNETELRRVRKLESLSRALDAVKSRRPLTAIIVGPPMLPSSIESMASVARILQTNKSTHTDFDEQLRYDLAILLPLPEFQLSEILIDPVAAIQRSLDAKASLLEKTPIKAMLRASMQGPDAVQHCLTNEIRNTLRS